MSNAIQKAAPSALDTLVDDRWTRAVIEVVRRQKCPKGISDDEFFVFLQQCKVSGLNPLLGHAYCVPRRTNVAPKGQQAQWVTNHVFQPAIDGMRARAAEFPDFRASDSAAVHEKDHYVCHTGTGEVDHKAGMLGQRGRLVGAWGRVRMKDGTAVVVELPVSARSGQSDFWTSDPGGMLAKCAEAAALRKAYPRAFGGLYVQEEMPAEEPTLSRAESVLRAVEATPAPAAEAHALPMPGPTVAFGEWRGRPVGSLSREEIAAAITYAEGEMVKYPNMKPKQKQALDESLEALRATLAMEAAAVQTPTLADIFGEPREPGQEG